MIRSVHALALVVLAATGSLGAQARPQSQDGRSTVPRTHLPPPGMCRIWLDNVPPAQQPAPTDCASAVRNQPRNGRVIFNDEPRTPRLPVGKSFKAPAQSNKAPDEPAPVAPKPVPPDTKRVKPVRPDPTR